MIAPTQKTHSLFFSPAGLVDLTANLLDKYNAAVMQAIVQRINEKLLIISQNTGATAPAEFVQVYAIKGESAQHFASVCDKLQSEGYSVKCVDADRSSEGHPCSIVVALT